MGQILAVLFRRQHVVVDDNLRTGRDRDVVDETAQRRVGDFLKIGQQIGQSRCQPACRAPSRMT
jgi:hypothetical protein